MYDEIDAYRQGHASSECNDYMDVHEVFKEKWNCVCRIFRMHHFLTWVPRNDLVAHYYLNCEDVALHT